MPTYVFILLHLSYLLFLIFLINTYVKHVSDENNNEILKVNSFNIFIPENPTYNELYISRLNNTYSDCKKKNINFDIKYINILPYSDILVSKNGLWKLLLKKYNKKILSKYFPKSYILENIYDRLEFTNIFYKLFTNKNKFKNNNIKKVLFLKKNIENKKGIKLFFIESKSDIIDIYNTYYLDNYNILQECIDNPYLYDNKIVILRVYLIIKKIPNKKYIFSRQEWIKCLYCEEDYNLLLKKEKIFISNCKFRRENYPKSLDDLILNINEKKKILGKIDFIFELIKKASIDLIFENNILNESIQFQLFGCDFILDNLSNPYLLEINKNPELNNNIDKNEELIKKTMISNMYDNIRSL